MAACEPLTDWIGRLVVAELIDFLPEFEDARVEPLLDALHGLRAAMQNREVISRS
jgi:hypothetical protein